jgi:uncharacterized membrane protein
MMFPQWHMDMSWMAITSFLWSFLALAAIVALVWLVLTISRADTHAHDVLDELLARGEIDADEYRRRTAVLAPTR